MCRELLAFFFERGSGVGAAFPGDASLPVSALGTKEQIGEHRDAEQDRAEGHAVGKIRSINSLKKIRKGKGKKQNPVQADRWDKQSYPQDGPEEQHLRC